MSTLERVVEEVVALRDQGIELAKQFAHPPDVVKLRGLYEPWYTQALGFISQIIPERLADFRSSYKIDKRKDITPETYTISDYLMGLSVGRHDKPLFDTSQVAQIKLIAQIGILRAAAETAPSVLRDVRTVLRAELFDSDVEAAKELLKNKHLRSAGVICGVVLEGHMKSVAARRGIKFTKKHLTISDLNDGLKNGSVYDVPLWRQVQRLGDIRNLCCHSGDREPTRDEVQDLIAGTEKVIKEVW